MRENGFDKLLLPPSAENGSQTNLLFQWVSRSPRIEEFFKCIGLCFCLLSSAIHATEYDQATAAYPARSSKSGRGALFRIHNK
jgi:hypothetical protein